MNIRDKKKDIPTDTDSFVAEKKVMDLHAQTCSFIVFAKAFMASVLLYSLEGIMYIEDRRLQEEQPALHQSSSGFGAYFFLIFFFFFGRDIEKQPLTGLHVICLQHTVREFGLIMHSD